MQLFKLPRFLQRKQYDSLPAALVTEYNKHRQGGPHKYFCYAPFKNIYFGHHGKAVACCYNRQHVLGTYPAQSIKQMWFGAEAEKLRDYIKHNDLSQGCLSCKNHINARNFAAIKTHQYDERTLNKNRYPSVMEFELSNLCNLECDMCSGEFSSLIRAKREKLPPLQIPYDSNFVNQLDEFIPYLDEVKFYGGEPFLIELYYDIWERIARINPAVRISVQTNGTTLNNRVKEILANTNFHINISIDSLKKEVYEAIRKNADYDRVMENVRYFHSYCKSKNTFLGISVCAMQQNRHELAEFVRFCNQLEVPLYIHTVFQPAHSTLRNLTAAEMRHTITGLEQEVLPDATPLQQKNKAHFNDYLNQLREWQREIQAKEVLAQIKNFDDLEGLIVQYVQGNQLLDHATKANSIQKIKASLAGIKQVVPTDKLPQMLSRFDMGNVYVFDEIIAALENLTPEEIPARLAKMME